MPSQLDMHNAYSTQLYRSEESTKIPVPKHRYGAWTVLILGIILLVYANVGALTAFWPLHETEMVLVEKYTGNYDGIRNQMHYCFFYEFVVGKEKQTHDIRGETDQRKIEAVPSYTVCYEAGDPSVWFFKKDVYYVILSTGAVLVTGALSLLSIHRRKRKENAL